MDAIHHHTQALIRKLQSIAPLAPAEMAAILRLPLSLRTVAADQDIVREGDTPSECCLVVTGFACRYNVTAAGKRQILSFHIDGDIPDLQSLHLSVMDHSLATLVPCTLAFIQHGDLRTLICSHPRLGDLFWRDTLIDAAVFRQWMVCMGRRSAKSHLAHLLCELLVRMKAVGLVEEYAFKLSATQAELGDAMGISTVHVNRVLQELRDEGLICLKGATVRVLDWEGLKRRGEFDLTYLHLAKPQAAQHTLEKGGLREGHADQSQASPHDLGPVGPPVRLDQQIELIGQVHRAGQGEPGAGLRDVADQTIDARRSIVEEDLRA